MSKTTKIIVTSVLTAVVLVFCVNFYVIHTVFDKIEDEGGISQIIVNTGKEIKDIKERINEE